MAEQLFCKQLVGGSIPLAGSAPACRAGAGFAKFASGSPNLKRLLALPLLLALAACSVTYVPPPKGLPPITAPSIAPSAPATKGEAAGNVTCPTTTTPAPAAYTGFGAPVADFNAGHQGQNLLVRCSTDLKVIVLQLDISPAADAANALAQAERQLPPDLKPVYDKSDVTCRDLQFQSATLKQLLGPDDPDGVVNIELESALQAGFKYDDNNVDTAVLHQQYNLGETQPCLR